MPGSDNDSDNDNLPSLYGVDQHGDNLKIYYRMYCNRDSLALASVVVTAREMQREVENFFTESGDLLPPIFEPVLMTLRQFRNLPEYTDFKDIKNTKKRGGGGKK